MNNIKIIFITFFVIACGRNQVINDSYKDAGVEPMPHVNDFNSTKDITDGGSNKESIQNVENQNLISDCNVYNTEYNTINTCLSICNINYSKSLGELHCANACFYNCIGIENESNLSSFKACLLGYCNCA